MNPPPPSIPHLKRREDGLCILCGILPTYKKTVSRCLECKNGGTICLTVGCDKRSIANDRCSSCYDRLRRRGTTDAPIPLSLEDRWSAKIIPGTDPDSCYGWSGAKQRVGDKFVYGKIQGERGLPPIGAHVASWIIHYGPVPEGLIVCHYCDNPICSNPKHLFVDTRQGNIDDKVAKGRANAKQPKRTHCPQGHRYDEANTSYSNHGHQGCKTCGRASKKYNSLELAVWKEREKAVNLGAMNEFLLNLPTEKMTPAQWRSLLWYYDYKCVYCAAPWQHKDHYLPHCLGGRFTVDNMVPACQPCNQAKKDKHPDDFTQPLIPLIQLPLYLGHLPTSTLPTQTQAQYITQLVSQGIEEQPCLTEWPWKKDPKGYLRIGSDRQCLVEYIWEQLHGRKFTKLTGVPFKRVSGCIGKDCWNPHHIIEQIPTT